MEILQSVRVRSERWRIADIRTYDACQLLTLTNGHTCRRVLAPFDDVEPIARTDRPRRCGIRAWRRALVAALTSDTPPGALRAAARARIDLLPHQLTPALAILRGDSCRVLLADDVGLGKTIQAGLIAAELAARRAAARVLVVAPAGVRDQWIAELRTRFAIDARLADARTLRQTAAVLPVGVNPWTTIPCAVASLDYLKRAEILPAVAAIRWDLVIVDEAHAATGESDRRDAVGTLTARAPYVVLVTATPHSGDDGAFATLCAFGSSGCARSDPLPIFRRTRHAVRGAARRRIHTLLVRPTAAERRLHEALARYRRAVRAEHGERALALSVLDKRAYSSPWAIAESVERRLLSLSPPAADAPQQLLFPIADGPADGRLRSEDEGELTDEDAAPLWPADLALPDAARERALLQAVLAPAREAAASGDSKWRALGRLLRRVRESALVFTEYRDTAIHLLSRMPAGALLLHGGLDRIARQTVCDAFNHRPGVVLVATDAAGQGLNLHGACRLVVNVDLPWNPMRLEQRIGRVDRIGQTRTVHAIHLVARGTGEARMLQRLRGRVMAARARIDAPDPIGGTPTTEAAVDPESQGEARRVTAVRALLARHAPRAANGVDDDDRPLVVRTRRRRLRAALGGRQLVVFRVASRDVMGRLVESRLAGVVCPRDSTPAASRDALAGIVAATRAETAATAGRFWSASLDRERAIADAGSTRGPSLFQPALFDRRALRQHEDGAAAAAEDARRDRERIEALERMQIYGDPAVELLWLVRPR